MSEPFKQPDMEWQSQKEAQPIAGGTLPKKPSQPINPPENTFPRAGLDQPGIGFPPPPPVGPQPLPPTDVTAPPAASSVAASVALSQASGVTMLDQTLDRLAAPRQANMVLRHVMALCNLRLELMTPAFQTDLIKNFMEKLESPLRLITLIRGLENAGGHWTPHKLQETTHTILAIQTLKEMIAPGLDTAITPEPPPSTSKVSPTILAVNCPDEVIEAGAKLGLKIETVTNPEEAHQITDAVGSLCNVGEQEEILDAEFSEPPPKPKGMDPKYLREHPGLGRKTGKKKKVKRTVVGKFSEEMTAGLK